MRPDRDPTVQAVLDGARRQRWAAVRQLWFPLLLVAAPFATGALAAPPGWRGLAVPAATVAYAAVVAMVAVGEGMPSALQIVAAQALADAGTDPDDAAAQALAATRAQLWELAGPDGPARVAALVGLPTDVYVARRELARRAAT